MLLPTQHFSSSYLYAQRDTGQKVTLIDVSQAEKPLILGELATGSLSLVTGTAALVSAAGGAPAAALPAEPQTLRIMDFSDPQHPKVAREFTGVTAMSRDDRRGLIFLTNDQGLWILRQNLATDPAVEKAYSDYVRYGSR